MAAFLTASLRFLLVFSFMVVSAGQRIITAEPGDNVTLPCTATENKDVIVVEWRRTDLESDHHVLLYRDRQYNPEGQPPFFSNRVDLLDVKNRDVSLVLKNVTTDDTGTYECRVFQGGNNRRKRSYLGGDPISTVYLRVEAGNEEKLKEDGGIKNGLIAGVIVFAAIVSLLLLAVFVICRRQRNSSSRPEPPPAPEVELQQVKIVSNSLLIRSNPGDASTNQSEE